MINLSEKGHAVMMQALTGAVRGLHLYSSEGELDSHGYAPKAVTPGEWEGNVYPKQTWTFEAGDELRVMGYFVTGEDGSILWSREFPQDANTPDDYVIGRADDRISVSLSFGLLMGNQ